MQDDAMLCFAESRTRVEDLVQQPAATSTVHLSAPSDFPRWLVPITVLAEFLEKQSHVAGA